jgi:hypothetical protein
MPRYVRAAAAAAAAAAAWHCPAGASHAESETPAGQRLGAAPAAANMMPVTVPPPARLRPRPA